MSGIAAVANDHTSMLGNLRAMQHKDANGLPIGMRSDSAATRFKKLIKVQ